MRRSPCFTIPALLLAAACAAPPAPTAATASSAGGNLAPNANLVVEGIPPIPMSLVAEVEKYTDFRGHSFVDWHPTQREMLVAHRKQGSNTPQLFRLRSPMGVLEPLTEGSEPVTSGSFEPIQGRYIVFERDVGGNEASQLYRLDLDTRAVTLLTSRDERAELNTWLHRSSRAVVSTVPLDRTAQGGRRSEITTTLWLLDPMLPEAKRKLAELPGPGWFVASASKDDRTLALGRYISAAESQVWLLDLESGQRRQLLPEPGNTAKSTHYPGDFSADGAALYVVSDREGEFSEFMRYELASRRITRVTAHIPWDVNGGSVAVDGSLIALRVNVDGTEALCLFDGRSLAEKAAPGLRNLPNGSVRSVQFHRRLNQISLAINSAQGPSQVFSMDPVSGQVQQWTRAEAAPGIDTSRFADQGIVRWPSFDGRSISGLISRPPARFSGKRPVLISIHGGPEAQAQTGFLGRNQYYVQELGAVLIQPNVRGSSGYGKSFLKLDDGMRREDSVKDIGALLDWIAGQPDLDPQRVVVMGGSYGGYMSLAVSTHYADRIAGALDIVGISHFVTFLEATESYRRDLRRVEYGDERDPAMRAFLDRISPLANAHRIRKPLFVVQGKNDPRVPVGEAEQIVAKARANGTPVWYLRAENEGHGFARKENADFQFYATIQFLRSTLLK